jgi:hypothetical protein
MSLERKIFKSDRARSLFKSYCNDNDIHSALGITYNDIALHIFGWLNEQPIETYNNYIEILESEILESEGKCFTGRISRLVSSLDGIHPGVRINITNSDQISNRIFSKIKDCQIRNLSKEEMVLEIKSELQSLELEDDKFNEWFENVKSMIEKDEI